MDATIQVLRHEEIAFKQGTSLVVPGLTWTVNECYTVFNGGHVVSCFPEIDVTSRVLRTAHG